MTPASRHEIIGWTDLVANRTMKKQQNHDAATDGRLQRLAAALDAQAASKASFGDLAAELRALTRGREHTPAEVLLRLARDER